jgi:hypothetical protein
MTHATAISKDWKFSVIIASFKWCFLYVAFTQATAISKDWKFSVIIASFKWCLHYGDNRSKQGLF